LQFDIKMRHLLSGAENAILLHAVAGIDYAGYHHPIQSDKPI
jgi:hypothetical protein